MSSGCPQRAGIPVTAQSEYAPDIAAVNLSQGIGIMALGIPRMALSVGFIRFVSSTDATQATRLLTLALVGLAPTEHASLRWTHSFANVTSARR